MRVFSIAVLISCCLFVATATPGLLVVLYSYPTDNGGVTWQTVQNLSTAYPSLPVMVIVNPSSGPGSSIDSTYVSAIQGLATAGIRMIGYIDTYFAGVSYDSVVSQMQTYINWYPQISGFFLDEMSNDVGSETYYANLTKAAVQLGKPYTMGNPGTASLPSYIGTVNTSVIFEDSPLPPPSQLDLGYRIDQCALIVYSVTASSLNQSYIDDVSQFVSWIWITDRNLPNPYNDNPTYLAQEIQYLLNVPSSPSSSPPHSPSSPTGTTPATSPVNGVPSTTPNDASGVSLWSSFFLASVSASLALLAVL